MSAISPTPSTAVTGRPDRTIRFGTRPMWAAIGITAIWLAVLFDGVFGPNIVGNDGTSVPSVVVVAFFAWLATIPVAKRGFRDEK